MNLIEKWEKEQTAKPFLIEAIKELKKAKANAEIKLKVRHEKDEWYIGVQDGFELAIKALIYKFNIFEEDC